MRESAFRKMNSLWTGFASSGGSEGWSESVGWAPYDGEGTKGLQ